MNWHNLASTLLGAMLTFSGILLTRALDIRKQRLNQEKLIEALLQGIRDEIHGLFELSKNGSVHPIDAIDDEKPYEGHFTASQDYFTVYHKNVSLVLQINDTNLRRSIIQTYARAKGLLDTISMNRSYLERYYFLQSTFLKTKEPSVQAEAEAYHRTLIQTAAQLKRMQIGFKNSSNDLLSRL